MFIYLLLFWGNYSLAMMSSIDIIKKPRFNATVCDFCRERHQKCVRSYNKSCDHCLKHNEICISRDIAYNHNHDLNKDMPMITYSHEDNDIKPKDDNVYRHKFWFEENIDNFLE